MIPVRLLHAIAMVISLFTSTDAVKRSLIKGDYHEAGFIVSSNHKSGGHAFINLKSHGNGLGAGSQFKVSVNVTRAPKPGWPHRSISITSPLWRLERRSSYEFETFARYAVRNKLAGIQIEWWQTGEEKPTFVSKEFEDVRWGWRRFTTPRFRPPRTDDYFVTISFFTVGGEYRLDRFNLLYRGVARGQSKPVRYYGQCVATKANINGLQVEAGETFTSSALYDETVKYLKALALRRLTVGGSMVGNGTAGNRETDKDGTISTKGDPRPDLPAADKSIMLYNSRLKVGLDMNYGASIWHLGPAGTDEGMINAHDVGRRIQQSFYGMDNVSNFMGLEWPWNPVQAGDQFNNKSRMRRLWHTKNSSARVALNPRDWGSGQLLSDVVMSETVKLYDTYAHIKMIMRYNGNITHPVKGQEMPAFFIARRFTRLWYYDGEQPWTNAKMTMIIPATWWYHYEVVGTGINIPERFVIYEDPKRGDAIGIMSPSATGAFAYRHGHSNDVQYEHAQQTSYVAPVGMFGISPGGRHVYHVYVSYGTLKTVREVFEGLHCMERDAGNL